MPLSLPQWGKGDRPAVDEVYTPQVYFLPIGKLMLSKTFFTHPSFSNKFSNATFLAATRSRSGENNTQLFSYTLAPLRYPLGKAKSFYLYKK